MKMKANILGAILIIAVVATSSVLSGCGGKNTPSPNEVNAGILSSHGWKLQSLQVDGVDKTSLYTGMTLSFTATTYTTVKGAPVWPASGTWSFAGTTGTTINRDDQVQLNVDEISDDQLVLSFTWNQTTFGGGRVLSVSGKHVYTFVK